VDVDDDCWAFNGDAAAAVTRNAPRARGTKFINILKCAFMVEVMVEMDWIME